MTAFLSNILFFARMLKRVGLPLSTDQTHNFCRALALVDIGSRQQVFYAARGCLVTRHEDLKLFETVFNLFWRPPQPAAGRGQKMPVAPRHNRPKTHRYTLSMLMARQAQPEDPELDIIDKTETFSAAERLQRKDFAELTPEELEQVKKIMQTLSWRSSERITRRFVADPRGGRLHLRRCLRAAAKYGGVPLRLAYRRPKIKRRPIVLLADISGSMEKYARLMLQFFYGITHSADQVEAFVFGTRLTRITPQLRLRNVDQAIDQAAREVSDWSGGTRIGESIGVFNRTWSRRVLRRGAIVVIISDGWERGDSSLLRSEMRYLAARCHRLIWLNPLSGRAAYRPRVEGMTAALPYIDDFLPINNLQSLSTLAYRLQTSDHKRQKRIYPSPNFMANSYEI